MTMLSSLCIPKALHAAVCSNHVDHSNEVKASAREWMQGETPFCVIAGANGTGKTTLSSQMLVAMYKRLSRERAVSAKLVKVSVLYQQWLDAMRQGSVYALLMQLGEFDVLVLDDLGVRAPAEGWREWLITLVDYRLDHLKRTIITTNLNAKDIAGQFGETFMSRILVGTQIRLEGEDRRHSK